MVEPNVDLKTVEDFGQEWTVYDQSALPMPEHQALFEQYFAIFPWDRLPVGAVGLDLGCGSGRWAMLVAPRVSELHCVDAAAEAIKVAQKNLAGLENCRFHVATIDQLPFPDESMDFAYCLGVAHHVPDPAAGIRSCTAKLKVGAPLLLYLYYAFDNRPAWFRTLWKASDWLRRLISPLPPRVKVPITVTIAAMVYYPLARFSLLLEKIGFDVDAFPLAFYRNSSFYTMKTDALDRFGTRLELRFTANQIRKMLEDAGLEGIQFSPHPPYWCAVGFKKS